MEKEVVFQLLNIISAVENNNSELLLATVKYFLYDKKLKKNKQKIIMKFKKN